MGSVFEKRSFCQSSVYYWSLYVPRKHVFNLLNIFWSVHLLKKSWRNSTTCLVMYISGSNLQWHLYIVSIDVSIGLINYWLEGFINSHIVLLFRLTHKQYKIIHVLELWNTSYTDSLTISWQRIHRCLLMTPPSM